LGRDRSQREPNLGKRVDVPTIHSADPLIFPLPKHFCGRVHFPDVLISTFIIRAEIALSIATHYGLDGPEI